jgi:hypothetical protein
VDPYLQSRVRGPAIALGFTGVLGIGAQVGFALGHLGQLGVGVFEASQRTSAPSELLSLTVHGGLGVGFAALCGAVGLGLCVVAFRMARMEGWAVAVAASVAAMLPCLSPLCIFGLPAGVWALLVLYDPEVREAFAAEADARVWRDPA